MKAAMKNRSLARTILIAVATWCGAAASSHSALAADARPDLAGRGRVVSDFRQEVGQAHIVSFGLFGGQSVFESEARGAASVLRRWLGTDVQPVVRFNGKRRASASAQTLHSALLKAGRAMDPESDVLVVVLTSHGSPEGLAVVAGRREDILSPMGFRDMLNASGAKYRAVIISACYSGVFVPALADERTLVITAAAPDRPSFGCQDGATWTYFGDAFFNRALRTSPTVEAAFETARRLVTAREQREGFEPSSPQMAGGSEVLARLNQRLR